MERFIVMTSSAKMPSSCWGRYANVAVVELEEGFEGKPKMISERAKGVKRIVEEWGPSNVGTTERCAHSQDLREAHDLAKRLNEADKLFKLHRIKEG